MDFKIINRLLGNLTSAFCVALLIPLLAACIVDKDHIWIFVFTIVLCYTVSSLFGMYSSNRTNQRLRGREGTAIVGCGWILICLLGALPYLLFNPADPLAAVFESVSGFTTTGVTTVESFNEFPPSILVWRCLTHWMGGIGVIMLFIIVMPQMNSGANFLFNAELPGGIGERTLPKIKESAILILSIYLCLTLLAMLLFLLCGVPVYQAINMALATVATGGFSYFHESLIRFDNIAVEIVCIFFMLIASINFMLYYKIWHRHWHEVRGNNELRYYLTMLAVASILICYDLTSSGTMSLDQAIRHSVFQSVSIGSTTGFASADFAKWPPFSRCVLLMLMFVGGCSGSTAGGIKMSRMLILLKAGWAELLRTLHPRIVYSIKIGDKEINPAMVGNVTRFFFCYILCFAILSILISLSGISVMESIGLIAACMSSVGPAFGIVGPTETYSNLSNWARFISIWAMLLGRLELFTLLVILNPELWREKQNW